MGNVGVAGGVGGVEGSLSGALSGAFVGGVFSWPGFIAGAIVGGIIGTATSAVSAYIAQQRPSTTRLTADTITTDSIRIKPVPVVFGRNRLGGNWIGVGIFWGKDGYKSDVKTEGCRIANGLLGLCEGEITAIGNYRVNGQLLEAVRYQNGLPCRVLRFNTYAGSPDQAGAPSLTDTRYGYVQALPLQIPFRNTCYIDLTVWCGQTPALPTVTCDTMGPDYTIKRSGTTGEPNPGDIPGYGYYDVGQPDSEGYFAYTLTSSGITSAPYGLVLMGRQGAGRYHTPPPSGVGSVYHAWYFGRHDVLIMQDPSDNTLFHLGYWTIAPNSTDWEHVRPGNQEIGAGYSKPILCWHSDEFHSSLHTLHDDGTTRYVLRWNVLTGHVDRIDTDLAAGSFSAMMYSVDLGYYIFARDSAFLCFNDRTSGETLNSTTGISTAACAGLCVSGQQIGVINAAGVYYWDVFSNDISPPLGTNVTDVSNGSFGGTISAYQNSFTGQVCITKLSSGTAAFINFIPSCVEDIRDINANGTSGLSGLPVTSPDPIDYGLPEPNFQSNQIVGSQNFPSSYTIGAKNPVCNRTTVPGVALLYSTDWIRDWSYRTYGSWALNALQGNSSLAAAAWAITVDEPSYDSQRYGAAFDPSLFSLPSFEGLHAWCVGAMRFQNSPDAYPASRLGERYKFDMTLDAETPISSFWTQHLLMACQGFSYTVGGIFHVGVPKPGQLPVVDIQDRHVEDSTFGVAFTGTADGVNRIRIQYRNVLDEYRHDFAETEDSNAIEAIGRVQLATLTIEGCGRGESAMLLAKAALDQSAAGRRQASFNLDYLAYILAPGDSLAISNSQCGLSDVLMRVSSIKETSDQSKRHHFSIMAGEYKMTLDALLDVIQVPGQVGNGEGSNQFGACVYAVAPSNDETFNRNNMFHDGAMKPAGSYAINYKNGAFGKGGGNWFVDGIEVWARNGSGTPFKLCDAPAVSDPPISIPTDPDGGYSSEDAAETANYGQTASFTMTSANQIYLKRGSGVNAYTQADTPLPVWELCQQDPI